MAGTEQLARMRASSTSSSLNTLGSGEDAPRTPMGLPAASSGSAIIDRMENPCPTATMKRGSVFVSRTWAGRPCSITQPAIPSPLVSDSDLCSTPRPERAPASSVVREVSKRRMLA